MVFVFIFIFLSDIFIGHNKKTCKLPSDGMILPSVEKKKKKKATSPLHPKCELLRRLGIDYLVQFSKKCGKNVQNYASGEYSEEIVELIEAALGDKDTIEAMQISVGFYLLHMRAQDMAFARASEGVFSKICEGNKISTNANWVNSFSFSSYLLF